VTVNRIRRNGSYAPLSAHYYMDDAIAEAGEKAELLYVRGLAFSASILKDGLITDTQLTRYPGVGMRDAEKRAAELVRVGLWVPDEERGGFVVRSWPKWNQSTEEIREKQRKDAERKANGS
jgi:hypothetical protein